MKPTHSLLTATIFLAAAIGAAPAPEPEPVPEAAPDATPANNQHYDDGSWYPGKYPGDSNGSKPSMDYGGTGHGNNHDSTDHHSDSDKSGHSSNDDDDSYKPSGQQNYQQASPFDYAPHGRERSWSRSRERVNQWHDANGHGQGHSYHRNWYGQGQYYLQRRNVQPERPRGRTLVRRGEQETPELEKRSGYGYDSWSSDGGYYPHTGRIRPLRPLRPIGYGYGGYHYLAKRSVDTEANPSLEKRSGYDDSDSDFWSSDNDHHRPYGGYYGRPYGGYGGYGYGYLAKRSVDTEANPSLEKRSGYGSDSDGWSSDDGHHHHVRHPRPFIRHPRPYNNWNWNHYY